MGQYHHLVNVTANQYLDQYRLGCGAKAWEQLAGGVPAALTALLAHNPGNGPADLGWHPLVGRWAGQRLLMVGDYAEDGDVLGYNGPPLSQLYRLCSRPPALDDFRPYTETGKDGRQRTVSPAMQLRAAEREWTRKTKRYAPLEEVARQIAGAVESACAVRFIGDGWRAAVPVKPYAERGADGRLHYELAASALRDKRALGYIWRVCGWNDRLIDPAAPPPDGAERYPWDRPPADLSWHNLPVHEADAGQHRVFANLDRHEFIDPAQFGEQPTTAGIMAAADCATHRIAIDMMVGAGGVASDRREGGSGYGSASAVFAMLLHPEPRGGGDISRDAFAEVGRWRFNRLLLTSAYPTDEPKLPSTDEVRTFFTDITKDVMKALAALAS